MKALSYAILAPNSHNRQPWLVRLDNTEGIWLYCQMNRRLPETDPFDRQILISLGCFGELLRMAAAQDGFDAEIEWFPKGIPEDRRLNQAPVAHIQFAEGGAPDPLFKQVLNRRSTKKPFNTSQPVEDTVLTGLSGNDPHMRATNDMTLVSRLRNLTFDAFMVEIETARTYKESVDLMRLGNKEVAAQPDGIDMGGWFFSMMKNFGLITREKIEDPGTQAYKQGIPPFKKIMHATSAYTWITSPGNSRLDQVKAGIQYVRSNLKAAKLGLSMHPVSQALQEYAEMDEIYKKLHQMLEIKAPSRIQMLSRLGYGPETKFSPRWPLKTRIIT